MLLSAMQSSKRTRLLPISIDMHVLTASEMQGFSPCMDSKLRRGNELVSGNDDKGGTSLPDGKFLGKGLGWSGGRLL